MVPAKTCRRDPKFPDWLISRILELTDPTQVSVNTKSAQSFGGVVRPPVSSEQRILG